MLIQALGSSELTEKEVVSHRNTCVALSSGPKYHSGIVIKPTSQMAFSQIHDCNCSIQIQSSTTALVCVRNGKKRNDRFIRLIKQSRLRRNESGCQWITFLAIRQHNMQISLYIMNQQPNRTCSEVMPQCVCWIVNNDYHICHPIFTTFRA